MQKVQAVVNMGKADIYGGNVSMEACNTPGRIISSYLNYPWIKDLVENLPLRHTTPLFGSTSVAYNGKAITAEFYFQYNGKRPFDKLPPSEQSKTFMYTRDGLPAWYTLNLRGSWKINPVFQVNAALENLLNHHYLPYSSGISAPGINLVIALKATTF